MMYAEFRLQREEKIDPKNMLFTHPHVIPILMKLFHLYNFMNIYYIVNHFAV